jgi:hypothetical protein
VTPPFDLGKSLVVGRLGQLRAILRGRTRDECANQGVEAVIGIGNIEALILRDAEAI